jgi:hypothetical protein
MPQREAVEEEWRVERGVGQGKTGFQLVSPQSNKTSSVVHLQCQQIEGKYKEPMILLSAQELYVISALNIP